jgi:hypothetical protein
MDDYVGNIEKQSIRVLDPKDSSRSSGDSDCWQSLFGTPDAIAVVEGSDIRTMHAVIDRVADVPGVVGTDSKVAHWID